MIEPLLKNLVYVRHDKDITGTLENNAPFIPPKKWREYCTFQAEYKDRVSTLRIDKREVPKETNADKNMPPILQSWQGKHNAAQPDKNLKKGLSCAFNAVRIANYEELNKSFATNIKLPAPEAAAKIIPLMVMDIAYLKSFDVEWEGTPPALATEGGAQDDDDMDDIDTSSWEATDPASVPIDRLKIPQSGKLPTALLYAAALLGVAEKRPAGITR